MCSHPAPWPQRRQWDKRSRPPAIRLGAKMPPNTWAAIPGVASSFYCRALVSSWGSLRRPALGVGVGWRGGPKYLCGLTGVRTIYGIKQRGQGGKGLVFKVPCHSQDASRVLYVQKESENFIFTRSESDSQDSCDSSFQATPAATKEQMMALGQK